MPKSKKNNINKILFSTIAIVSIVSNLNAEPKCELDGSQRSMNICAEIDANKVDNDLNSAYKQLLEIHKNNKTFITNLKESQKAWLKFRDAEAKMRLTYSDMPGNAGSMNAMMLSSELEQLTKERTKTLKKYIKDGIFDMDLLPESEY